MVSVDCEACQESIKDKALGERESGALVEILTKADVPATLFVLAADLEASAGLYRQAFKAGCEIGLHLHPSDIGYGEFLGIYGPEEQTKIISNAADRFAQVMGFRPRSICPGYHSANDYTYPVLVEHGFEHGRVSSPMRNLPECASAWPSSPLDAHYAHAYNRILKGTLNFVDLPHTIDPDSLIWGGRIPLELRVEMVDAKDHWYTINKAVERQLSQGVALPYISIVTHNLFDYSEANGFRRKTLEKMLVHAKKIIESNGCLCKGATFEEVAKVFRNRFPLDKMTEPILKLNTGPRS